MAEELLETVERLQSRLLDKVEPRKLLKTLKRLGELPMTVDILVETGVGRTVNSLRKNELAGDLAKHLVAKWKRLVPTPADRPREPEPHGAPRSSEGRGRREPTAEEEEEEEEEQEPSYVDEDDEMEEKRYRGDYSPSPPPPTRRYSPGQRAPDGGQRGGYQSEGYESPEPEPSPPPPPPPPPPPRSKEVKHKEAGRTHHGDREEERRRRLAEGGGGGRSNSDRKRRGTAREQPSGGQRVARQSSHRKERKGSHDAGRSRELRDSPGPGEEEEAEEFDTPTMSFESFLTYDAPTPVKKKKKLPPPGRPPHAASSSSQRSHPPAAAAVASSSSSSSSSKASRSNGTRAKRPESGPATARSAPEKRRRAVEVVVALPEIPLPAIQPNYRPLPSIDLTPLSPQRRKVPVSNDEEDSGFTGRRFNSKMSVYSGAKTAFLPKMMSLYEQCIRVLQNNIDSIDEVGGVPFEILEPVLERCTPEQLYRIEQCNQCFTEDSDDLWMRHCRRDFKREAPQEYESWRETYLRLHDEREERLRMLTQNISSAHANKPKGRQVKLAFVNSVAKPPRDVRRRQEKFGTTSTSTASSTAAAAPIKIRPASSYSSHSAEPGCSSSHLSPSPSSRASGSSGGGGGGGGGGHTPRDNKPQVKKIAPMMAKTIKAFKNRFSRR